MPGRIPQSFIDELIARVDIVEVIDERVPLKKSGRDYMACCPFHDEKTPSFSVSPTKQFYYCFGCSAHGTVVGFLMDYARLEFTEAIEELAERAGMEVPREALESGHRHDTHAIYAILEKASAHYRRELCDNSKAGVAVDYLKGRGLSGETAQHFGMGYAPPGWDGLLSKLGGSAGERALMTQAGLLIDKGAGSFYDRFRNRVTFPIRDRRGRTIGFGARALGDETPKYLNSPETPVFHKGHELYGLYEARQANRTLERLFVVEGYMDVVSLAQFGITNSVATLGTAATAEHMVKLFRTTPRVVFCFDGDEAGKRAAWRAAETLLPLLKDGWLASFIFLPDGQDPDTVVRSEGAEGFLHLANEALSLSAFLFEHLLGQTSLESLDDRARLVELARPLLTSIQAPAFKNLALKQLSQISGLDGSELSRLVGERGRTPTESTRKASRRARGRPSLVRKAITLLLHSPDLGSSVKDTSRLRALDQPGAVLLAELLDLTGSNPTLNTGAIVERFRSHDEGRHLAKLASESAPALDEGLEREFRDAIDKLGKMVDDQRFEELAARARAGTLTLEEEREFGRLVARPTTHQSG